MDSFDGPVQLDLSDSHATKKNDALFVKPDNFTQSSLYRSFIRHPKNSSESGNIPKRPLSQVCSRTINTLPDSVAANRLVEHFRLSNTKSNPAGTLCRSASDVSAQIRFARSCGLNCGSNEIVSNDSSFDFRKFSSRSNPRFKPELDDVDAGLSSEGEIDSRFFSAVPHLSTSRTFSHSSSCSTPTASQHSSICGTPVVGKGSESEFTFELRTADCNNSKIISFCIDKNLNFVFSSSSSPSILKIHPFFPC